MAPLALLPALLLMALTALPAGALEAGDPEGGQRDGGGAVDRSTAADIARRATGGRVLGIQGGGAGERDYRVRVLTPDGTVRTLRIDGRSGRLQR